MGFGGGIHDAEKDGHAICILRVQGRGCSIVLECTIAGVPTVGIDCSLKSCCLRCPRRIEPGCVVRPYRQIGACKEGVVETEKELAMPIC